jgi:hypothetical protein
MKYVKRGDHLEFGKVDPKLAKETMDESSFRILFYILSECDTMHIGIPTLQILILK